ncbi:unnamed protein product [Ostreobium quekettii]|uniref:Glutamate--cysteine ligase n=1 Tax=Ostreobium quekettii TaxID=121088 RepID=A0A8S1IZH6_9CHLO|nr:unnamed protein product [Ostreobium quekettii]|eukprot:evm.model.scf_1334.2 EVM.evm.TU.scf_1334.2   scf_1334:3458-10282(-)
MRRGMGTADGWGGDRLVVRASNQTTERILTKDDLLGYMQSGCKPRSRWRIGTEHEKLGFNTADNRRINYEQISNVLRSLERRFGWQPIMEGDNIIGVKLDGQSVTLEPGGQFELSGAPLETLHQTCGEVNSHLYQVKAIAEEMGISFLGIGFDPTWEQEDVPMMPKGRYKLMKSYMPTVGGLGLDMMFRSCTIQVNLDFESEKDMVEKFRIGLCLQPIATALFANSPFKERKPNGYLSWRSKIWTDTDAARCGNLPFVFDEGFGFERYVEHALDVPMYFVYRNGTYVDCLGMSFRDFMEGKLPSLPGVYPTMDDFESHLSTLFPEVRLKKFLEMRGADGGPWKMICALPALWVGLLYDEEAQRQAADLVADWSRDDRDYLLEEVAKTGLRTPFRGRTVLDLSRDVVEIAKGGLLRRGFDEASFLGELENVLDSGVCAADTLLHKYNTVWNQSVDPVYAEYQY